MFHYGSIRTVKVEVSASKFRVPFKCLKECNALLVQGTSKLCYNLFITRVVQKLHGFSKRSVNLVNELFDSSLVVVGPSEILHNDLAEYANVTRVVMSTS
jgi:hypothetical protein